MLMNILKQINWVDIFVALLILRILYISAKTGVVVEVFKLIGIIVTIYISLHYYTTFSDYLINRVPVKQLSLKFLDFVTFVSLVFLTYALFVLIRNLFCHFIKMEAEPALSKWGGFILGIFRGVLAASLIISILSISSINYLNDSARKSYFGGRLFGISLRAYSVLWNNLMSKFMTNEKFNKQVLKIQDTFDK